MDVAVSAQLKCGHLKYKCYGEMEYHQFADYHLYFRHFHANPIKINLRVNIHIFFFLWTNLAQVFRSVKSLQASVLDSFVILVFSGVM